MITELFTTEYGLIAVAATIIGLLLPLGFHLFIRSKIRESELALVRTAARSPSGSADRAAAPCVDSPAEA